MSGSGHLGTWGSGQSRFGSNSGFTQSSHFKLFLVSGSGSRLFRMLGHLRVWVDLVCGVVYLVVELETRVALGHQVDKIILE